MEKIFENNQTIFLAGASGMVGSAIKRALLKMRSNNKKVKFNLLTPTRKELDLLSSYSVQKWFASYKPTIVILAAAKVGGIVANSDYPVDFLLENIKIQTNVIESAFKQNAKRFIFLGSSCIYPKFTTQPIKEESLLDNKLEKTNESYAIAKITGLKLCEALRSQYNFDAISLMPTNLYGPGDNYDLNNSHVIPALIKKFCDAKKNNINFVNCWGNGSPKREFMHVDDLAEACIFALEKFNPNENISFKDKEGDILNYLNVGTGIDISIYDLAYKIAEIIDFKGKINWDLEKPNGTPLKRLDITKLSNLGWRHSIDLNKGLKETIDLYQNENNLTSTYKK